MDRVNPVTFMYGMVVISQAELQRQKGRDKERAGSSAKTQYCVYIYVMCPHHSSIFVICDIHVLSRRPSYSSRTVATSNEPARSAKTEYCIYIWCVSLIRLNSSYVTFMCVVYVISQTELQRQNGRDKERAGSLSKKRTLYIYMVCVINSSIRHI